MFTKNKKIIETQLKKLEHLQENGIREINMQNAFFDSLDKKSLWVFTIISATQFYIFENYFAKIEVFSDCKIFFLYSILIGGLLLQVMFLWNYMGKKLATGPGIDKQIKFGVKEKSFYNLLLDSVVALKKSVIFNAKVLSRKAKIFGYLMIGIYIYYTCLFIFLIIFYVG